MIVEIGDQAGAIGGPAFRVAECVQLQRGVVQDAELVQNLRAERNRFDIGERLRHAQQLDPDLVELSEPSLLGAFVAEHRPAIEIFERQVLRLAARNQHARHPGGALGAQRHLVATLVGEAVHLLGDDVRGITQGALEHLREFEDRGGNFLESEARRRAQRDRLDMAVTA